MNAIILSIGDELVLGQTVDTNSAWLSQHLAAVGCDIRAHLTVGDDQHGIEQAILESVGRCDFLLISGGIGPTPDDLTRQALAAVMNVPLEPDDRWMAQLAEFFEKRGRKMPEGNRIQAMIPRGATMIFNHAGTAAGIDAPYQSPDQKTVCRIFVMPGVPKEMKLMFQRDVLPHITAAGGGSCILSKTLHTFGMGESAVAERLGDLMRRDRNPSVGTTVSGGVVSIRINARECDPPTARRALDETIAACQAALGDLIYGADDETLPQAIADLLKHPAGSAASADSASPLTVTTAESCTGGLIAKMLTDVPGSSAYFKVGFVTYANQAKYERLGVPTEMLNLYGAVSEPVVDAMAKNARRLAKASFALAVSGIAGPDGGSAAKPVGTVCIALAAAPPEAPNDILRSKVLARTFNFPGDREMIRDRSAKMALAMLRYHLLGKPMPF